MAANIRHICLLSSFTIWRLQFGQTPNMHAFGLIGYCLAFARLAFVKYAVHLTAAQNGE